jgi:4a-hydroxytetrahydrobiopterin dehydratase
MAELPRQKASDAEIQEALKHLPGWKMEGNRLHREYKFKDFVQAFGFMASVALIAESMSHHPEWRNVYNQVVMDLWTHTHNGVTNLDLELARKVEAVVPAAPRAEAA